MVGVVEIASTSQVMSFVHYAQDLLRLPQYLGYTPLTWCPQRDSNPQNSDFESDTYTNSITGANFGGEDWGRTSDTRIFNPLLYQLSYIAKCLL